MTELLNICIFAGMGVCFIYAWRRHFAGGWCYSQTRLDGKTVVVTGANTGIGKETARDLARRGAKVILACRNLTKAQEAADDIKSSTSSNQVVIHKLDLSSLASIRAFAKAILEKEERLDVLVNNAGVGICPQWKTEDGFDIIMGVNHFGHFLLTNLLLDLLKKSAPSRIVNVSSEGYVFAKNGIRFDDIHLSKGKYDAWLAYGQSKLANILFSLELSKRLRGTGVTANSLHPGAINTELDRNAHKALPLPYITVPLIRFALFVMGKTTVEGAQTSIYCSVDESIAKTSGVYFKDCAPRKLKEFAKDEAAARQLWELSAEAVGLEKKLECKSTEFKHQK